MSQYHKYGKLLSDHNRDDSSDITNSDVAVRKHKLLNACDYTLVVMVSGAGHEMRHAADVCHVYQAYHMASWN